jgi:hypothetical protein
LTLDGKRAMPDVTQRSSPSCFVDVGRVAQELEVALDIAQAGASAPPCRRTRCCALAGPGSSSAALCHAAAPDTFGTAIAAKR